MQAYIEVIKARRAEIMKPIVAAAPEMGNANHPNQARVDARQVVFERVGRSTHTGQLSADYVQWAVNQVVWERFQSRMGNKPYPLRFKAPPMNVEPWSGEWDAFLVGAGKDLNPPSPTLATAASDSAAYGMSTPTDKSQAVSNECLERREKIMEEIMAVDTYMRDCPDFVEQVVKDAAETIKERFYYEMGLLGRLSSAYYQWAVDYAIWQRFEWKLGKPYPFSSSMPAMRESPWSEEWDEFVTALEHILM
ncbi:hypothetical protein B0T26DRAFT_746910 [Lasiosphaeria miniovina]|uniref:Uncharacterized protein n=1 Tax=Lasiosphaeria miniovina TaxID=1954250 RepID=A0AA40BJ01_9PEZI|nr:uncharacterized protein B0T26DRAFT_746910 [Lasiosphaeria miniovina]KAK0735085.1 hypothetical protein B0T26DRAFT_746910 [Lasiosphaeria miniovina]